MVTLGMVQWVSDGCWSIYCPVQCPRSSLQCLVHCEAPSLTDDVTLHWT